MSETTGEKLELRYVPLEQAVLWERNAKKHDYGAIMKSIQRYGFLDPMKFDAQLNNGQGGIVEGNGRATALRDMYMYNEKMPRGILQNGKGWLVPMLFGVDAKSQAMAEAYAVDHNNTTLMGGDFDMLQMASMWEGNDYAALLKDLQANDMAPVSMDDGDISALLHGMETQHIAAANDEEHVGELVDNAEELQKKWQVQLGDIWQIGEHILLCGDCTNFDDWKKLLQSAKVEKINGIFTSPPYAEQRKKQYGGIPTDEYVKWWYDVQANARAFLAENGSFFVNIKPHCENGERVLYVFDLVLAMQREWKWRFVDELCWYSEGLPGYYPNRFRNSFEPVYHFSLNIKIKFDGKAVGHFSVAVRDGDGGLDLTGGGNYTINTPTKSGIAQPGNVLKISAGATSQHAAAFPFALPEFFIKAYSDKNDIWLDPFLGSGTTICAAHRNNRRGLGIEKLPKYVAVCLERIAKETNKTPKRIQS